MDNSKLVEVYRANNGAEAALIKNGLEDAGIRVLVEEDLLQGAYGLSRLSPRISVFQHDAARASELLSQLRHEPDDHSNGGLSRPKIAAWCILALTVGIPVIRLVGAMLAASITVSLLLLATALWLIFRKRSVTA